MSFCCRRPTALINCALVLLALAPAALCAQTIRGVVVNRASVPVSGVVVLLIDSLAATSAQALSNERGEFRLVAPRAGTYRTRALRIGFRPEFSQPFTLRSGEEVQQRTTLDGVQLALDTMHVLDQNVCRLSADSAAVTFAVWEQIRAALTAAQLTRSAQSVLTTSVAYDRTLDETAHHVREQHSVVSTAYGARAWHSLTPDSLHRVGYVVSENDLATTYYAPDLDVLLSDLFLRDHCFRLTTKRDKSVLGLAFQSTSARKRVAEVRGTLWIDRKTSALRNLEFGYENIPAEQQGEAGGEMNFVALKNGEWAISKWNIRMPEIARVTRPASMGGVGLQLVSIRVNGGELALATKGGDTLWRGIPIALNGTVVDSLTGKPVSVAHIQLTGTALNTDADSKGHFSISGVLPGEYTVDVHTASLDSVSSVHRTMTSVTDGVAKIEIRVPTGAQIMASICGNPRPTLAGVVIGSVQLAGDSIVPLNTRVFATWAVPPTATQMTSASISGTSSKTVSTRASALGDFRFCDVAVNTTVSLRTEVEGSDNISSVPITVTIPANGKFAHAQLMMHRDANRGAVFAGVVHRDSTQLTVDSVEIAIPELSLKTFSDQHGAFQLTDIPPGAHRVIARKVGYRPLDTPLSFSSNRTETREIFLQRVVLIDSVVIVAEKPESWRVEFDEHRKLGFGQFLTREQLAKKESQTMNSVLAEFRGTYIQHGMSGNHGWMTSSRSTGGLFVPTYTIDVQQGARPACYSDVFLNNSRAFSGRQDEPLFDLNTISPASIEAIEFYANRMVAPARYNTQRDCGVLVIHTRR